MQYANKMIIFTHRGAVYSYDIEKGQAVKYETVKKPMEVLKGIWYFAVLFAYIGLDVVISFIAMTGAARYFHNTISQLVAAAAVNLIYGTILGMVSAGRLYAKQMRAYKMLRYEESTSCDEKETTEAAQIARAQVEKTNRRHQLMRPLAAVLLVLGSVLTQPHLAMPTILLSITGICCLLVGWHTVCAILYAPDVMGEYRFSTLNKGASEP